MQTSSYNTEVAELGIACGACHGAAALHAERAASPLTRTFWQFVKNQPKEIVNPVKLTGERAMQVCGHCHGQRVPVQNERIREILTSGDPYDAGEDLAQIYRPIDRDTRIGDYSFANRFWANGSPRLTAYEYQGILRSRCYTAGAANNKINCLTCHTMHGGDVKGQITEAGRTNQPCLQCHEAYGKPEALVAHTHHAVDSEGSRCYNCHMPRVVYGVMTIHPTHDITIPNPQLTISQAVPNACNQCHLDRSVNWAIAQSKRLWAEPYASLETSNDKAFDIAEGARALFAGDALTRALMTEALGNSQYLDWRWRASLLVEALADNYPIVRYFAANGLARINDEFLQRPQLAKPDYLGSKAALQNSLTEWRRVIQSIDPQSPASSLAQTLRASRQEVDLEVGE
jgi:predicted CXXCH cytochrome family protein